MYGVSRIQSAEDNLFISFSNVDLQFMTATLNKLANAGVVVDMISQAAPPGKSIRFSFTAAAGHLDVVVKTLGSENMENAPMISSGYTKINLYGEDMVDEVGVAARALAALGAEEIEIAMITTSDYDISILLRQEDADVAISALRTAFKL